jgi:diacylglycerol kinase family enzyme
MGGESGPRTTLIVNPRSGRGRGERYARELLEALRGHGLHPMVLTTQRHGHAQDLAALSIKVLPQAIRVLDWRNSA